MSFEVACGNCQGRLLVEHAGIVVACPHCGVHLSIPAQEEAPPSSEEAVPPGSGAAETHPVQPDSEPVFSAGPIGDSADSSALEPAPTAPVVDDLVAEQPLVADQPGAEKLAIESPEPMPETDEARTLDEGRHSHAVVGEMENQFDGNLPTGDSYPNFAWLGQSGSSAQTVAFPGVTNEGPTDSGRPQFPFDGASGGSPLEPTTVLPPLNFHTPGPIVEAEPSHSGSAASATAHRDPTAMKAPPGAAAKADRSDATISLSKTAFLLLVSYASAITLGFLYLLMASAGTKPHELESLPDLVPPERNGQIALRLAPEDAEMPPGHTLRLGESQRFGNVLVTPLRVTRGPLRFEHQFRSGTTRPDSDPVLKLWLRFENVSHDQTFAPLDSTLLLSRRVDPEDLSRLRANNFLARSSEKSLHGHRVLVYDLPIDSEWGLVGQSAGRKIGPGESLETFIPTTEEGIAELEGELIWRVQFRKGYHPQSRRGVTTLIEVVFSSSDIESESAPQSVARVVRLRAAI